MWLKNSKSGRFAILARAAALLKEWEFGGNTRSSWGSRYKVVRIVEIHIEGKGSASPPSGGPLARFDGLVVCRRFQKNFSILLYYFHLQKVISECSLSADEVIIKYVQNFYDNFV